MSLMRWEPLSELSRIRKEMDRVFEEVFGSPVWEPKIPERWVPSIDIYEAKEQVVVRAELPGVKKEDLEVITTDDSVTIKGEMKQKEETSEPGYFRRECHTGSFVRTVPLPVQVKSQEAKAQFKEGILEIRLPKSEELQAKEKKIPIE